MSEQWSDEVLDRGENVLMWGFDTRDHPDATLRSLCEQLLNVLADDGHIILASHLEATEEELGIQIDSMKRWSERAKVAEDALLEAHEHIAYDRPGEAQDVILRALRDRVQDDG